MAATSKSDATLKSDTTPKSDATLNERLAAATRRRNSRDLLVGAVLVVLAALFPLVTSTYPVLVLTNGLIIGLVAVSFSLLAGFAGMISLAQMAFYGMAAYVIGILGHNYGLPPVATVPLALASACLLAAFFGLITARSTGIYFLIMTLALLQLFHGVGMQWQSVTGGYNGIAGIQPPTIAGVGLGEPVPLYLLTVAVVAICYLGLRWLLETPFGLTLQGIRDRTERMRALGFRTQLHRWLLMILSGLVAGIAGILGVYYHGVVSPSVAGFDTTIMFLLAALIGGVSSLLGGLIGGIFVTVLTSFTSYYMQQWFGSSHYWTVVGIVFVIVVIYFPHGVLDRQSRGARILIRGAKRLRLLRTERHTPSSQEELNDSNE